MGRFFPRLVTGVPRGRDIVAYLHILNSLAAALALWACAPSPILAQRPIVSIHVNGNERIPEAAVVAASGLRVGQVVTQPDMDAVAQRLLHTGFFSIASYRCDPVKTASASGFAVVLEVTEEDARTPVLLDIPGQDAERLWSGLMAADPLIGRKMPDNELATTYYQRAIQGFLRRSDPSIEIVARTEGKIGGKGSLAIFRPAQLPKIGAVAFEGNPSVPADVLQDAVKKLVLGEDYTEYNFRRIVELNIRPLYEERARLTVAFPAVRATPMPADAVAVTVTVDEGPAWTLGKVNLTGEGIPAAEMLAAGKFAEGAPANWKEFLMAVERMRPVLTRDGYLRARMTPARSFREGSRIVDVTIDVNKGRQFVFGGLRLSGLDAATEQTVAPMWRLRAGEPMNAGYVDEYLRKIWPYLKGRVKTASQELTNRPDSAVMDVHIAFR